MAILKPMAIQDTQDMARLRTLDLTGFQLPLTSKSEIFYARACK